METNPAAPPALPDPAEVLRAIDLFLLHAYTASVPTAAVSSNLAELRTRLGRDDFFNAPAFLRPTRETPPQTYTLRLGNQFYPHMKLIIQPAPDGGMFLFRADTHDRHLCPAENNPEYPAFITLRANNQAVAEAIENAWMAAGICTFKTYLQNDLKRRRLLAGATSETR